MTRWRACALNRCMVDRFLPCREALRLGLTEKFLAEDQPPAGSNGHVRAALSHRRASLAATLP